MAPLALGRLAKHPARGMTCAGHEVIGKERTDDAMTSSKDHEAKIMPHLLEVHALALDAAACGNRRSTLRQLGSRNGAPRRHLTPPCGGRLNASSREEQTKRPGWPGLKTATKEVAMTDNQELT